MTKLDIKRKVLAYLAVTMRQDPEFTFEAFMSRFDMNATDCDRLRVVVDEIATEFERRSQKTSFPTVGQQ